MKHATLADPPTLDYASIFSSSPAIDPIPWNIHADTQSHPTHLHPTHQQQHQQQSLQSHPHSSLSPSYPSTQQPSLQQPNISSSPLPLPPSVSVSPISSNIASPSSSSRVHNGAICKKSNKKSSSSSYVKKDPNNYSRAPIVKPCAAEEQLVRCIHRKVGGPAKLSTYDDPAKVRHVVIEALANEQPSAQDAQRIRKGQLSVFERRVVRTVTNRGAAVRSRMRQRKEMAALRHQLAIRDARVLQLEGILKSLCSAYSVPLPTAISDFSIQQQQQQQQQQLQTQGQGQWDQGHEQDQGMPMFVSQQDVPHTQGHPHNAHFSSSSLSSATTDPSQQHVRKNEVNEEDEDEQVDEEETHGKQENIMMSRTGVNRPPPAPLSVSANGNSSQLQATCASDNNTHVRTTTMNTGLPVSTSQHHQHQNHSYHHHHQQQQQQQQQPPPSSQQIEHDHQHQDEHTYQHQPPPPQQQPQQLFGSFVNDPSALIQNWS